MGKGSGDEHLVTDADAEFFGQLGEDRMRQHRALSIFVLSASIAVSAGVAHGRSPKQAGKPPVVPPRKIHIAKPDCSSGQSCHGIHGLVVLDVDVLTDGTVGEVEVTKPGVDQRLIDAATAAAKQCRFEPGTFNGKPKSMKVVLEYKF
jgi:TonB family protein